MRFGQSRFAIIGGKERGLKDESKSENRLSILSAAEAQDVCIDGLIGQFNHLDHNDQGQGKYFKNEPHWDTPKREKVKRFRFVICSLVLVGLAFGLMSRMILNLAIVEMTKSKSCQSSEPSNNSSQIELADVECDGLHFDWSVKQQNFLLASFYIGYAPSMFFSGAVTDKYGPKLPLLVCLAGSSIFNMLTPIIAASSFSLLIGSRIASGFLQGCMIPAIYGFYNSWLTLNETSIFIPLSKVSAAIGLLIGSMLPGAIASLGLEWPFLFYIGGLLCFVWSIIWFLIATSKPQDNRFVQPRELEWIMRKKTPIVSVVSMNSIIKSGINEPEKTTKKASEDPIPWLLIITCPSVLALTLVKFTYNLGTDFLTLEQATYFKNIHSADMSKISTTMSASYLMQTFCITFVGWAAKELVSRKAFGFSVTAWRKIFQSIANFGMAFAYFTLQYAGSNFWFAAALIVLNNFTAMMNVGGESMVPYDLSAKYPATIMGLAHSVSVLSGVTAPTICSMVLGDDSESPERWNTLFVMIGSGLVIGNLVFICFLKAEPFLPGEKKESHSRSKT